MKKLAGLFVLGALLFTVSTASATADACADSGCVNPPYPVCYCEGGVWVCPY